MWREISPFKARDKVGHAIRFALRHHQMRNSNSSSNTNSTTAPSETTSSEDATVALTTAARNDSERPASPSLNATNALNVNELLIEPLYWDEFDSVIDRHEV